MVMKICDLININELSVNFDLQVKYFLHIHYSKNLFDGKTVSQIRSRQLAHGDFIGRRSSRNAFIVARLANLK